MSDDAPSQGTQGGGRGLKAIYLIVGLLLLVLVGRGLMGFFYRLVHVAVDIAVVAAIGAAIYFAVKAFRSRT